MGYEMAKRAGMNLVESISTRATLLERLRQWDDHSGWQEFFNIYWRLIHRVALRAGLKEDEAEDVVQETVIAVARNMPQFRYDPTRCSFKTWLLNMTRWRIVDRIRRRAKANAQTTRWSMQAKQLDALGCWWVPLSTAPNPSDERLG
jgi:DNA-directed RNA polymerase specialized sigma24 family protein